MEPRLPTDDDTNVLFDNVVMRLKDFFGYSHNDARSLAARYYDQFRDPVYCQRLNIPVQDDDFFHHQGAGDVAMRIQYYLRLNGDPHPNKYHEWRKRCYEWLRRSDSDLSYPPT